MAESDAFVSDELARMFALRVLKGRNSQRTSVPSDEKRSAAQRSTAQRSAQIDPSFQIIAAFEEQTFALSARRQI